MNVSSIKLVLERLTWVLCGNWRQSIFFFFTSHCFFVSFLLNTPMINVQFTSFINLLWRISCWYIVFLTEPNWLFSWKNWWKWGLGKWIKNFPGFLSYMLTTPLIQDFGQSPVVSYTNNLLRKCVLFSWVVNGFFLHERVKLEVKKLV